MGEDCRMNSRYGFHAAYTNVDSYLHKWIEKF